MGNRLLLSFILLVSTFPEGSDARPIRARSLDQIQILDQYQHPGATELRIRRLRKSPWGESYATGSVKFKGLHLEWITWKFLNNKFSVVDLVRPAEQRFASNRGIIFREFKTDDSGPLIREIITAGQSTRPHPGPGPLDGVYSLLRISTDGEKWSHFDRYHDPRLPFSGPTDLAQDSKGNIYYAGHDCIPNDESHPEAICTWYVRRASAQALARFQTIDSYTDQRFIMWEPQRVRVFYDGRVIAAGFGGNGAYALMDWTSLIRVSDRLQRDWKIADQFRPAGTKRTVGWGLEVVGATAIVLVEIVAADGKSQFVIRTSDGDLRRWKNWIVDRDNPEVRLIDLQRDDAGNLLVLGRRAVLNRGVITTLYRSSDLGKTWKAVASGQHPTAMFDTFASGKDGIYLVAGVMDPAQPATAVLGLLRAL